MSPPNRRRLLRCGLTLAGVAVAGCTSVGPLGDDSAPELEPAASVSSQPSEEAPGVAELGLTNSGGEPASVYPREPGSYVFHLVPPFREESGDIFLLPRDVHTVELYQGNPSKTDGCWRVIDTSGQGETGPYLAGQSLPKETEIEPGETYAFQHDIYFHGPEAHCYPAGEYRTTVGIERRGDEETDIDLNYTLEVSPETEMSLSVTVDRDPDTTGTDTATSA